MGVLGKALWRWLHRKDGLVQFSEDERAFTASEVLLLEAIRVCVQDGWDEHARYLIVTRVFDLRKILRKVRSNESDSSSEVAAMYERAAAEFQRSARLALKTFGAPIALDAPHSTRPLEAAAEQLLMFLRKVVDTLPEDAQFRIDSSLCEAHRRRVLVGSKPEGSGLVNDRLHSHAFIGLAMSGGGIRSASFSIGVLQALAKCSLLPSFNYVSSVSGGGYAASWMMAWAYRHKQGLHGVSRELASATGVESGPLRWVRRYSSYLAPKLGVAATSDAPALVTAYIFNWIPIFLFICLSLTTVLLIPHWIEFRSEVMAGATSSDQLLALAVSLGVLSLFIGLLRRLTMFCRAPTTTARYPYGLPPIVVGASALVSIVLSVTIPALLPKISSAEIASYEFVWFHMKLGVFGVLYLAWLGVYALGLLVAGVFSSNWFRWLWDRIREFVLRVKIPGDTGLTGLKVPWMIFVLCFLLSPLLAAACTYYMTQVSPGKGLDRYIVVVGPLVVLTLLAASEFVTALVAQFYMNDVHRAWLARVAGWMVSGVCLWIAISACALLTDDAWIAYRGAQSWTQCAMLVLLMAVCGWAWRRGRPSVIYVLMALGFVCAFSEMVVAPAASFARSNWGLSPGKALLGAGAIAFLADRLIDVNRFSLHSLYRDGLVRTFLGASRLGARNSTIGPPVQLDDVKEAAQFDARRADAIVNLDEDDNPVLAQMQAHPDRRLPLLLLNAAVNGRSPEDVDGRVPRQWPYTFSSYFSGSPANGIGYARSSQVFKRSGRPVTLGTAMAVSGAAVSPTAGRITHPVKALLLGLLNARLGLWIGNPRTPSTVTHERPSLTGLAVLIEALGIRSRFGRWIHLSDGGHFENLGVYELLRRGCSRIVVIDSSCDPKLHMSDLANAFRRARIDLGVIVRHPLDTDFLHPSKGDAEPSSGGSGFGKDAIRQGKSDRWRWFTIDYGAGLPFGRLLYIKPMLGRKSNLPIEVSQYAKTSKTFPHETTADQFFSEAQMEAYRSLGQACGSEALQATAVRIQKMRSPQFDLGLLAAVRRAAAYEGEPESAVKFTEGTQSAIRSERTLAPGISGEPR